MSCFLPFLFTSSRIRIHHDNASSCFLKVQQEILAPWPLPYNTRPTKCHGNKNIPIPFHAPVQLWLSSVKLKKLQLQKTFWSKNEFQKDQRVPTTPCLNANQPTTIPAPRYWRQNSSCTKPPLRVANASSVPLITTYDSMTVVPWRHLKCNFTPSTHRCCQSINFLKILGISWKITKNLYTTAMEENLVSPKKPMTFTPEDWHGT